MFDLMKMKLYVAAPLFIAAIYFSLFELSSQYNTDRLLPGARTLPGDMHIWYRISNNKTVHIKNGENQLTPGLIDGEIQVCAIEIYRKKLIVRRLWIYKQQVKVGKNEYTNWTQADTDLYDIDFNAYIQ
ncbi:uncharacterized protein LOC117173115 [Belonocnema kinseyi]|uniref:uncharacterized protein LOC117173115 n=1 Tax=Belonocnema kinseyi TaxID=2817044 RepID=UPI00143D3327|nr:uncharacterized protein LOC117173115 [Belonocnema kinseyi]